MDNVSDDKKGPKFALKGNKPAPPYWIVDAEKEAFDDSKYKAGDEVPGIIVSPFTGDRGDIAAKRVWKDGVRTVVFCAEARDRQRVRRPVQRPEEGVRVRRGGLRQRAGAARLRAGGAEAEVRLREGAASRRAVARPAPLRTVVAASSANASFRPFRRPGRIHRSPLPRPWPAVHRERTVDALAPTVLLLTIAAVLVSQVTVRAQSVPGQDPVAGARVFVETAGCVKCHAIAGSGGRSGPTSPRPRDRARTTTWPPRCGTTCPA